MIRKYVALAPAMALLLGSLAASPQLAAAKPAKPAAKTVAKTSQPRDLSRLIWVRMVPFWGDSWQLKDDYTGQDILDMIEKVKPDVLERFVQFQPTPNQMVPMGKGRPPMKFYDFLNAAIKAEAPGGFMTPKVHQNDVITDEERLAEAQAWRKVPVNPQMKLLSLDTRFRHGTLDDHKRMLQQFKAMGWDLGFNFAGGGQEAFGLGTYAQAEITPVNWEVSQSELKEMDEEGIKTRLAHIDYPEDITEFGKLTPDRQADIVLKLSADQHKYNFTFVYPVFYGKQAYDSSRQVTKADGPYKGATVLDVIAEAARCDRLYPKPCPPHFGGSAAGAHKAK